MNQTLSKIRVAVASPSFVKLKGFIHQLSTLTELYLNNTGSELDGDALIDLIGSSEIVVIGKERVDESILSMCPNLKFIAKYGVGMDQVDLNACQKYNVKVGFTPGVNAHHVAEHVLGQILSLMRNISKSDRLLKSAVWEKNGGISLIGKTVGIIGVGYIGKALIDLLKPFHCEILMNDILDMSRFCDGHSVKQVSKEALYQESDIISLHVPLTSETQGLINSKSLKMMKKSAFLINSSRGAVVNLDDLYHILNTNQIAGAALDVFEKEPMTDHPILSLDQCLVTPHIAANSVEATRAMGQVVLDSIYDYVS